MIVLVMVEKSAHPSSKFVRLGRAHFRRLSVITDVEFVRFPKRFNASHDGAGIRELLSYSIKYPWALIIVPGEHNYIRDGTCHGIRGSEYTIGIPALVLFVMARCESTRFENQAT